jgi:hypothetical protein
LQGYSQGAAATTNALPQLTGAAFDAVKGVFLLGNPQHVAGLACNVDIQGGDSTRNVNGLSARAGQIPQNWISKTQDVCNFVSLTFFPDCWSDAQLTNDLRETEFAIPLTV